MIDFLKKIFKLNGKEEIEEIEEDEERYILWVTRFDGEGYSSSHYGWNRNQTYNHKEALEQSKRLEDKYYSIKILKCSDFKIQ